MTGAANLFDAITRLPEYTRPGRSDSILDAHAKDIAEGSGADTLVELGAGTCDKSRVLLDAMQASGNLVRFVPLDVNETTLWEAANGAVEEYPGLAVSAVVGTFTATSITYPPAGGGYSPSSGAPSAISTPGNARDFLIGLGKVMATEDRLLLGTDLVKDRTRLINAYDDAAGVTAEFNRNVLHVLNRELGRTSTPNGSNT